MPKKKIPRLIATITVLLSFGICMFPYELYCFVTWSQNERVRKLFFDWRMESMALLFGVGLFISGLWTISKRHYDPNPACTKPIILQDQKVLTRNPFLKKGVPRNFRQAVLKGKKAVAQGVIAFIIGCFLLFIGLSFWLGVFIPELIRALR